MRGTLAVAAALLLFLFGFGPGVLPAGAQGPARDETDLVVRQLGFEGNEAIPSEVLANAISTTNSSWFARKWPFRSLGLGEKRYFNEEEFQRDVLRLHVLYRRSGYPDVTVDTTVRRTQEGVWITFAIREGRPILVRSLELIGIDTLRPWLQRILRRDLPLETGDPFNRYAMQATADSITRRLKDRGYPEARVFTAFETKKEAYDATVQLETVPGGRAVVGDVRVVGTRRIEPTLVRNLLVSRAGRRYSQDELVQSQRNLYDSDLFRYATVNIDSAAYRAGADSVPLLVQVNEAKPRRIRGQLGFGTEDCFRGALGWTTRNFLGSNGRVLELTSRLSKVGVGQPFDWGLDDNICSVSQDDSIGSARVNYYLGAAVRRPAFLSSNNTLSISLYSERRSEFNVYLRRETGTTVTVSRESPRRRFPLSLSYNLSYGRTEATEVSFCASFNACTPDVVDLLRQNRVLATLTGNATLPRVNNPVDPSRGSVKSLEVTLSSRLLGSSRFQQFLRIVGDAAWYRPLTRDVVLSWRLRGGVIFSPTVDVATERGNFIPPEQRFYAGGPNDVRGFERNELGPVVYVATSGAVDSAGAGPLDPDDVTVAATGGNTVAVGNVELRVPSPVFSQRLRLAAYVDVGGAWQRGAATSDAVIRLTPGVGLRLTTPLGPARVDVAYNPYKLQAGPLFQVDPEGNLSPVPGQESFVLERERRVTLHFAVGQAF
jgi:outer membrane protein assembly complex protein YaeT